MSESQHRRGDAQDRTGVRQTRPSGTRQTRPSGANGTRRPSSSGNPKRRRKRRKKRSVNSRIGKVLLIVAIVIAFAVAGAILGTVFGILQSTDMLNTSDVLPDSYTSVIYDADDNEVDKLHGEENREYVKLSAITTICKMQSLRLRISVFMSIMVLISEGLCVRWLKILKP